MLLLQLLQVAALIQPCPAGEPVVTQPDTPAATKSHVMQEVPQLARKAGLLRATIGLAFVVDVDGKPCDIDVLSPSEFSVDEAAVKALKQWQFTPATKARLPVRTETYAQFNFIT